MGAPSLGDDHPDTAESLRGLGELLHTHGEVAQARHYLAQALAIFEHRLGPQHPDTEQTHQALMKLAPTQQNHSMPDC